MGRSEGNLPKSLALATSLKQGLSRYLLLCIAGKLASWQAHFQGTLLPLPPSKMLVLQIQTTTFGFLCSFQGQLGLSSLCG